ncbi:ATP-binding cassette domain-containing protein, partial [Porphyromonas levii]
TAVIQGNMTLGMMLAVQYIIGQLNSPVEQLIQFIYSWQDVSISLDRMNEIHTEENEENSDRHVTSFALDNLDIKVENLSFKYDIYSPTPILDHLNLTIPNGKVTAIVGASGSGKTTLIKLLLGYYSPLEGSIKVSGRDLEEYNLSWWRSHCGAVM